MPSCTSLWLLVHQSVCDVSLLHMLNASAFSNMATRWSELNSWSRSLCTCRTGWPTLTRRTVTSRPCRMTIIPLNPGQVLYTTLSLHYVQEVLDIRCFCGFYVFRINVHFSVMVCQFWIWMCPCEVFQLIHFFSVILFQHYKNSLLWTLLLRFLFSLVSFVSPSWLFLVFLNTCFLSRLLCKNWIRTLVWLKVFWGFIGSVIHGN